MRGPHALASTLVAELRSPLARVELAVGQLRRELHTPAGRELAEGISGAVAQADADITRILALLSPRAPSAREADLHELLDRLRERISPVLDARGTRCEFEAAGPGPLCGDPVLVEQAALALARVGSGLAGRGGALRLSLARHDGRLGIVAHCRPAEGEGLQGDPERSFGQLLPWVARHGGRLEGAAAEPGWRAELWLGGVGP